MRRTLGSLVVAVVLGGGCRSRERATPPPPPAIDAAPLVDAAPPIDATPVDAAQPIPAEEAARRAGQATGLGAGAPPPAVIVEPMVVALATGQASLSAILDARGGVVEVGFDPRGTPRVRHQCGGAARDLAATYLGRAVDRQLGGGAPLACDNQYVAAPAPAGDPRAALGRHAVCRSPGADDGGAADGLVFTAGADGALRLKVVIALTPGRTVTDGAAAAGRALARGRCP